MLSPKAPFLLLLLPLSLPSSAWTHTPTPYQGDLSGCGKPYLFDGDHERHITSSGKARQYKVHLPAHYNASHAYPLIVGYHGSQSIGLFFEVDTKLNEPRFTADKIMLYPNGLGGAWAGPSYAKSSVAEDLQFTHDFLADARREFCIDSARIYATGISNGGGFVGTLACNDTVGGEFAAFAPAAGSFYTDRALGDGCAPARDVVPLVEFHGGADETVRYGGGKGEGGLLPSIPDWLDFWSQRNGCSCATEEDSFNGTVHHYSWTCRGQEGALQHWKVDTMKHVWPSTEPNFSQLAAGDKPTHIQASSLIQTFFDKFVRPAE